MARWSFPKGLRWPRGTGRDPGRMERGIPRRSDPSAQSASFVRFSPFCRVTSGGRVVLFLSLGSSVPIRALGEVCAHGKEARWICRGCRPSSGVLWREREVLDNLLYRLDVQQLLLLSGRDAWLARASREIEEAVERVRRVELERAVHFEQVARDLGLGSSPSLSSLAAAVDDPWRGLLTDHYEAFMELSTRIKAVIALSRELAVSAQQATQDVIAGIRGESESSLHLYKPSGTSERDSRGAVFVDEGL